MSFDIEVARETLDAASASWFGRRVTAVIVKVMNWVKERRSCKWRSISQKKLYIINQQTFFLITMNNVLEARVKCSLIFEKKLIAILDNYYYLSILLFTFDSFVIICVATMQINLYFIL